MCWISFVEVFADLGLCVFRLRLPGNFHLVACLQVGKQVGHLFELQRVEQTRGHGRLLARLDIVDLLVGQFELLPVREQQSNAGLSARDDQAHVGASMHDHDLARILIGDDMRRIDNRFQDFFLLEPFAHIGQVGSQAFALMKALAAVATGALGGAKKLLTTRWITGLAGAGFQEGE